MRLNFLSNKIRGGTPVKVLVCVIAALTFCRISVLAAAAPQVTIEVNDAVYTEAALLVDATVSFTDTSLYNEQIYLSYHVLDENGEMLVAENQRLPVSLDKGYAAHMAVTIYYETLPSLSDPATAKIQFDLVDQKNAFWFALSPEVDFQTEEIVYDNSLVEGVSLKIPVAGGFYEGIEAASAISVMLNVLVWAMLLFVFVRYVRAAKTVRGGGAIVPDTKTDSFPEDTHEDIRSAQNISGKFEFITWLRGIACLSVLFFHYASIYMLSGVETIFPQILPRPQGTPRALAAIIYSLENAGINLGAFGVAIFFLITGFVTASSLDRNDHWRFLLKRVIRIWPVYIVGTALLYLTSYLYTGWAGTVMPGEIRDFVIQASLVRDWLWVPSVDQIGWTLEVQVKMYLILFLLSKIKLLNCWSAIIRLAGLGALFVVISRPYMDGLVLAHHRVYVVLYTVSYSAVFIIFAFIGVAFFQLTKKEWTVQESVMTGVMCMIAFYFAAESMIPTIIPAYCAAVLLFAMAYGVREKIHIGRGIRFLSTISFSLYIVHGVNGYYLLSVLDSLGISPYLSFAATACASILAACILYRCVEKPCIEIAARGGSKVQV